MKDRLMPPSDRADKKAADEADLKQKQIEARERIVRAMRATFSTPDGQIVLKFLADECQFGKPILGANISNGTIDEKATLYQAMRQNLYLKIRSMLTFDILKEVEYDR